MIFKIPFKLLNIEGHGYHLMVNAEINGNSADLLIDTGASKTVFDINRIKKFLTHEDFTDNDILSAGLGTNTLSSKITVLNEFTIGDLKLIKYQCVLIDMKHVMETYQQIGLQPFEGVLGSDILYKYKASIDYKTRILKLRKRK